MGYNSGQIRDDGGRSYHPSHYSSLNSLDSFEDGALDSPSYNPFKNLSSHGSFALVSAVLGAVGLAYAVENDVESELDLAILVFSIVLLVMALSPLLIDRPNTARPCRSGINDGDYSPNGSGDSKEMYDLDDSFLYDLNENLSSQSASEFETNGSWIKRAQQKK